MNKYTTGMVSDPDGDYIYLPDHISAIDAVLKEAVRFAEDVVAWPDDQEVEAAQSFLASPAVRDYRARQEQA